MLKYEDIYQLKTDTKGVQDPGLEFKHVSIFSDSDQPKGLYIPFEKDARLDQAITNGAIAALWEAGMDVPSYTPTDFPIIFVESNVQAYYTIVSEYLKKPKGAGVTKFDFYKAGLLNKTTYTYDIAVEETGHELLAAIEAYIASKGGE